VLSRCAAASSFVHLRSHFRPATSLCEGVMKAGVYLCWLVGLAGMPASVHAQAPEAGRASNRTTHGGGILQENEGERRLRRPRPGAGRKTLGAFIIKVDQRNGGSTDFFMGYEDIPPGAGIPPHHHPHSGEILFIQRGTGSAVLGSRRGTVGPGSTIYIPRNTRVSLRNTGSEPLTIAFLFPGSGTGGVRGRAAGAAPAPEGRGRPGHALRDQGGSTER
jgi:mannose-6-phosphate isomerase-like protein (cupin superfamily)